MFQEVVMLLLVSPYAAHLLHSWTGMGSKAVAASLVALLCFAWSKLLLLGQKSTHQKDYEDVAQAHNHHLALYDAMAPMHRPPLNVYAAYASAAGVLDGLEQSTSTPTTPVSTACTTAAVQITNNTSLALEICCKEASSEPVFVLAGQETMLFVPLEQNLSEIITLLFGGFNDDFSTIDVSISLDTSVASGVTVSAVNGVVGFAPLVKDER